MLAGGVAIIAVAEVGKGITFALCEMLDDFLDL